MSSLRPRPLKSLLTFTRASPARHCSADGVLVTVDNTVPRMDYDPATLEPRGLLIEEGRTNFLIKSQELDNATWTKVRSSTSTSYVPAPDGTLSVERLVEDSTVNDTHHVRQSYTKGSTTESQAYAASIWAKAGERTQIRLACQGTSGAANSAYALFDLSAGTASAVTSSGAWDNVWSSIEEWPNGWYRCRIGFRVNNDGQTEVQFVAFLASGGQVSYTGNGSSGAYLWGAQLEKGVQCTSYIPTTTAAATRSADTLQATQIGQWFNERAGTLYAEYHYDWPAGVVGDVSRRIVDINDGSVDHRFLIYYSGQSRYSLITAYTVTQFSANHGTNTGVQRHVMAWEQEDYAAQATGSALATGSTKTLPTGINRADFGSVFSSSHMNGHLRKLKFYPRRLSNAEVSALVA